MSWSSCSAIWRWRRPSRWISRVCSMVSIKLFWVCCKVSISITPRSDSRAVSMADCLSMSALRLSKSLVVWETWRWLTAAFCWRSRVKAIMTWFSQSGMAVWTETWIFSARAWLVFWIIRICGACWTVIWRVKRRSWVRLSKRSKNWLRSLTVWTSIWSPEALAFSMAAGMISSCNSCILSSPAAM